MTSGRIGGLLLLVQIPTELIVRGYRRLTAWRNGMDIVEEVYRLTRQFPRDEQFVLVPQMRRAAISIPYNVAEGNDRDSAADHRRFITIARNSVFELETQSEIATRLEYVSPDDVARIIDLLDQESRMLFQLRRAVTR